MLLLGPSALAGDLAELSLRAQEVVQGSCADVASGETTVAARQARSVVDAWAEVSDAYEVSSTPWLLYWRGALALCLGQTERGRDDLRLFLERSGDDKDLAALQGQARRHLVRTRPRGRAGPPRQAVPGLAFGAVMTALAGGAGGGAAALSAPISDLQGRLAEGGQSTALLDASIAEGDRLYGGQIALVGVGIGLGLGSVIAFVDAAVKTRKENGSLGARPAPFPRRFALNLPADLTTESSRPSFLFAWALPQGGIEAPAEYNNLGNPAGQPTSASIGDLLDAGAVTDAGGGVYTATNADAFPLGAARRRPAGLLPPDQPRRRLLGAAHAVRGHPRHRR